MAELPLRIVVPCPVFTHLGMDLAGPFEVTRESGGIATRGNPGTMKVYAVIFLCLTTHAVHIALARGYSTEDFLLAWDGFVADRGQPATVHTDQGSQLVFTTGGRLPRPWRARQAGVFHLQEVSTGMELQKPL